MFTSQGFSTLGTSCHSKSTTIDVTVVTAAHPRQCDDEEAAIAAQECSPRRKPWVRSKTDKPQPGRKKLGGWPMLSPHANRGCPALLAHFARGRGFLAGRPGAYLAESIYR